MFYFFIKIAQMQQDLEEAGKMPLPDEEDDEFK